MAKRSESRLSFSSIRVEGGLLLPDVLAKIAAGDAPEQNASNYDIPPGLKLRDEVLRYWALPRRPGALRNRSHRPTVSAVRPPPFARDLLTKVLDFDSTSSPKGAFQAFRPYRPRAAVSRRHHAVGRQRSTRSVPLRPRWESRFARPRRLGSRPPQRQHRRPLGPRLGRHRLRLLRDNDSLTRPALIEVDLDKIFAAEDSCTPSSPCSGCSATTPASARAMATPKTARWNVGAASETPRG